MIAATVRLWRMKKKGQMITNTIAMNATAPALFPLPIFVAIAFVVAVSIVFVFRGYWRNAKKGKP